MSALVYNELYCGSLNEHAERPDKAACVIRPLTQSVWRRGELATRMLSTNSGWRREAFGAMAVRVCARKGVEMLCLFENPSRQLFRLTLRMRLAAVFPVHTWLSVRERLLRYVRHLPDLLDERLHVLSQFRVFRPKRVCPWCRLFARYPPSARCPDGKTASMNGFLVDHTKSSLTLGLRRSAYVWQNLTIRIEGSNSTSSGSVLFPQQSRHTCSPPCSEEDDGRVRQLQRVY